MYRKAAKPNDMLAWKFFANITKLYPLKQEPWNRNDVAKTEIFIFLYTEELKQVVLFIFFFFFFFQVAC